MQSPIRILVVDDDQDLARMFWLVLAKDGFKIMTAFDGHVALEEVRVARPDLVLLDIMLPGNLNGIEVCRQLRADPALNGVKIIMVTARAEKEVRQAALNAGANDYWVKPINPVGLAEQVRAALNADTFPSRPSPAPSSLVESVSRSLAELMPEDLEEVQALVAAKLARRQPSARVTHDLAH